MQSIHRVLGGLVLPSVGFMMSSCSSSAPPAPPPKAEAPKAEASRPEALNRMSRQSWGKGPLGQSIDLYTLRNAQGSEVAITNYGATIVSIKTKDRTGKPGEITIGFDNLDGYLGTHPYFGAIVGRYANRIGKGLFELGGVSYQLATNDGPNHLHGGRRGFDKMVWDARPSSDSLELHYLSRDGEESYPGNIDVRVTYSLNEDNELKIDYLASTDRETHANITNHAYFNLTGSGDILNHEMQINAEKFTPVDSGLIPTGELKPVKGTPFDFLKPVTIGSRIDQNDPQLRIGKGYDHNWVVTGGGAGEVVPVAEVFEPTTGRTLNVYSDQPGVQFYSGNFLDGTIRARGGKPVPKRGAFCLETQHFPDSPNKPAFPSTLIKPGRDFKSSTKFKFSAR
jgi:aldose 1-epimerase